MTAIDIEKVRKAAQAAAAKLAEVESIESARQAEKAAERLERQQEKDTAFLSQWEALDAELQEVGSKSAADAIYEGADPIAAVANFWIERAKRNAVRSLARSAYYRLHGQHPDDLFARDLPERDMRIADRLEDAIVTASRRHGADLADKLAAEWLVQ
ncbi:hypothetical protein CLM62_25770 [Streptomyces sp. SA15]|uniref:hypothetical protein n=1 Tax=Streptomyces sp. SA15 TaxID=934019 RepID=UPI000BAE95B4|nr:hypothetical protein [Streptomyces sp. SA15]PAZ13305.1 hypothetical protein CLM62_25770 [Streptomyces sp. SA15]